MRRALAPRIVPIAAITVIASCTSLVSEDGGSPGLLAGSVSIGPICPVEREGEPCPVPPGLYAEVRVHVRSAATLRTITRATLDDQGRYRIELPAGSYLVRLEHQLGIVRGENEETRRVRVEASETTVLDFEIDTGIR